MNQEYETLKSIREKYGNLLETSLNVSTSTQQQKALNNNNNNYDDSY